MRTPVFELHILPMIRATDREHMRFSFDLWDYDQLVEHAAQVETRLTASGVSMMPPAADGGPWPDEWVELFRRWRDSGFKRLKLGTADYTFGETGTPPIATVQATGTYPEAGYNAWLQIESETNLEKTYVLYFEARTLPLQGLPRTLRSVNVTASSQAYQSAERYSFEIRRDFSKYIHYPPPRLRTVFNCVPRKNVE